MIKLRRGAALSTVIIAIFVLATIGACVMNLVVYNYTLRQLDVRIERAEYKNEILMDKIYEITQNTIITSIGMAKKQAVEAVDKAVNEELELYKNYTEEKQRLTDEWANALGDTTFESDAEYQQALNIYINENLSEEHKNISFYFLNSGVQNQYKIQNEYDVVFKELYKYALDRDYDYKTGILDKVEDQLSILEIRNSPSLLENITNKYKYSDIFVNPNQDLIFNVEEDFNEKVKEELENDCGFVKPTLSYNSSGSKIILSNKTLYKAKKTPTAKLSADFILSMPKFSDVAAIEQQAIEFSNPLIGNKALVAGGMINISDGSEININGDAFAKGGISGSNVSINSNGKIITAGDIILDTSTFVTDTAYYQNLYLNGTGKSTVTFNGDVYARDDLEIETGDFEITQSAGNYYGFNDDNDKGPDASSSIIINAHTIDSNSYITLNNLYLAGRAFIAHVINVADIGEVYKTGESISVIGNYVAYQTPISNTSSDYSSTKVNYAPYMFETRLLNLVNSFVNQTSEVQLADFDVNHKWKYFVEFAKYSTLEIPKITINSLKYMQGAGVGRITSSGSYGVVEAKLTGTLEDPAFKTNCANEYDLQTKYLGYNSPKTEIFGENGWLNTVTVSNVVNSQPVRIYNGNLSLDEEDLSGYRIIICSGDININVTGNANFSGVMIAGGNININGNVNFNSSKNDIINIILEGVTSTATADSKKLYLLFKYDGSGTRYIITVAGDSYININNLLGITNWTKKDWGYI